MAGLDFEMVWYAGGLVVLRRSRETAGATLEKPGEWMAGAALTRHPNKSRTVDMGLGDGYCDFLG